jgi:acyl-CoA-binding protein
MSIFDKMVISVNILNTPPTDEEKNILYGLYKQTMYGNINVEKPYLFDLVGRSKWNSNKDKNTDQAKTEYVEFVKTLILKYGLKDEIVL